MADAVASAALISLGLLVGVGLVVLSVNWASIVGHVLPEWRIGVPVAQFGLVALTAVACGLRIHARRWAWPFALVAGVISTIALPVTFFLLWASLPCPSFC